MPTTVEVIREKDIVNYVGDVHITGSIGAGASISVVEGSITIDGNVGPGTEIMVSPGEEDATHSLLHIKGNIGEGVRINCKKADIIVNGSIHPSAVLTASGGRIIKRAELGMTELLARMGTFGGSPTYVTARCVAPPPTLNL